MNSKMHATSGDKMQSFSDDLLVLVGFDWVDSTGTSDEEHMKIKILILEENTIRVNVRFIATSF